MTYRERVNLLHEQKIRDTLAKKRQKGYMDLDDNGGIPIPDDFHFTPVSNSSDGGFYGATGFSVNMAKLLDAHPVYVDPIEILAGRRMVMLLDYQGGWPGKWPEHLMPYDELKEKQKKYDIISGIGSNQHYACDFDMGIKLGFPGLLAKIRKYREINGEDKYEFYDAHERVLLALMRFIQRHVDEIAYRLEVETNPEYRATLREMYDCNRNLLEREPRTMLEVCQWLGWFYHISWMYNREAAGMQLDTFLYPFYKADKEAGLIDDDKTRFIIFYRHSIRNGQLFIRDERHRIGGGGGVHFAIRVIKRGDDACVFNIVHRVQFRRHIQFRRAIGRIGLPDGGGKQIDAVAHEPRLRIHKEVDIAVNAMARIPAAGRRLVRATDNDDIFLAIAQIVADVKGESQVSAGILAHQLSVDIDGRVHVYAVKVHRDLFALIGSGYNERLAIEAHASRQIASAARGALGVLVAGELKAPIVGNFHSPPTAVIKIGANDSSGVVERTIAYIRKNLTKPITREDLGKNVFLNSNYLARIFKEQTGQSLFTYIANMRLEQASLLLKTTQLPIVEICGQVGIEDCSYFSRLFKRKYGMTPRQYRSLNHNQ